MNESKIKSPKPPKLTQAQAQAEINRLYTRVFRLEKALRIAARSSPMDQPEIQNLISLANG